MIYIARLRGPECLFFTLNPAILLVTFWDTTSAIESAIGQTNVKAEGCNSFTDYKNKDPSYLPMKCDHCYK